jgi:threonine/homoserine/homoserine lactone efflux protein
MGIAGWLISEMYSVGKGMLLGLLVAAPVGPIGILCIQRTMLYGWRIGLLTGLGAASADGLYATIAAFGLTSIVSSLAAVEPIIRVLGGIFVLWIGIRLWRSPPATQPAQSKHSDLRAYSSTLLLTLANPLTIVSFIGLFGAAGMVISNSTTANTAHNSASTIMLLSPGALALGVLIGSACWWLLLSGSVQLLHLRKLPLHWLQRINRLAGALLVLLGLLAIMQSFIY